MQIHQEATQHCLDAIDDLCKKYKLLENKTYGNETRSYIGKHKDSFIRLNYFRKDSKNNPHDTDFLTVDVAFGSVRHIWDNRTPLGELGLAAASGHFQSSEHPPLGGDAIPGNDINGFKWRQSFYAPKLRSVLKAHDFYIVVPDIVEYLFQHRFLIDDIVKAIEEESKVLGYDSNKHDATYGLWNGALNGW